MTAEFRIDWERAARTGVAEAVLCQAKRPEQVRAILAEARGRAARLLLTRLEPEHAALLSADDLDYDPVSRTAVLGGLPEPAPARVAIVAAGTSDLPAAREALRTLEFHGEGAELILDVGVAGLHRLLERIEAIRRFPLVIALAGMEGALFSVLGGLITAPLIAVPTSVGLGVAAGGQVALHAALASCAPGIVTVNIDNGFGAAAAALKLLRAMN